MDDDTAGFKARWLAADSCRSARLVSEVITSNIRDRQFDTHGTPVGILLFLPQLASLSTMGQVY